MFFFKHGSSSLVSVRAYWLSKWCCVHRHRKQYLSFGDSFVTGKSITIILPNCIWNYNASEHLDRNQSLHSTELYTVYPSRAPVLLYFFLLVIVLSVLLRYTDFDYLIGIFKLFLCNSEWTRRWNDAPVQEDKENSSRHIYL